MILVGQGLPALDAALNAIEHELVQEKARLDAYATIVNLMQGDHGDALDDDVIAVLGHLHQLSKALSWLSARIARANQLATDTSISGLVVGQALNAKFGMDPED